MNTITLKIPTVPSPKGSVDSYTYYDKKKKKTRSHVTDHNSESHKSLRKHIAQAALNCQDWQPSLGEYVQAVEVKIIASKQLSAEVQRKYLRRHNVLPLPTKKHASSLGDVDKLARAVLDALSGIFYKDDAQVTCLYIEKRLTEQPDNTLITITYTEQP